MNCVNTQITGGDGSEMKNFPAMFVANLASVDKCPTTESMNVAFPNPGAYVTTKTEHDPYPLATPTGEGCSGGAAAPSYAPAESSAPASLTTPAAPTKPTPVPTPVVTSIAVVTSTVTKTAAATPETSFVSSGICPGKTVPCPTPGLVVCIDSARFGICDVNFCALPGAVAPGTVCSNGKIARRVKRSLSDHNHFHQHAARNH